MRSEAKTVKEYLDELPEDRRKALAKVRTVIRKNLPKGIKENINWGMITYELPLSKYPDTYNSQPLMYAALASQKNHMAVYLTSIYSSEERRKWFQNKYLKTGQRMDIGKSCVRFTKLEDLPLELIGEAISSVTLERFISEYEESRTRK
jgi:uncharacterized protein YdhG (YjbR/CyaY superfamily)